MIAVPVSVGELIDKITILEIKAAKIACANALINVNYELIELNAIAEPLGVESDYKNKLVDVNTKLWDVEDKLRIHEKNKTFENDFVALARLVYIFNDERALIKRDINIRYKSTIVEEKYFSK
jgi:hypothetical protein